MTPEQMRIAIAEACGRNGWWCPQCKKLCDRFRPEDLCADLPGVNIADECRQLAKAGFLVKLWSGKGSEYYAVANQLTDVGVEQAAHRANLHKLDAECNATRRTLGCE